MRPIAVKSLSMDRNANNPEAVSDPTEDLMRELVALSERVELQGPALADRIVAGFRRAQLTLPTSKINYRRDNGSFP